MQIKVLDAVSFDLPPSLPLIIDWLIDSSQPWTEYHTVDQRGLTTEDPLDYLIEKVGVDKAKQNVSVY